VQYNGKKRSIADFAPGASSEVVGTGINRHARAGRAERAGRAPSRLSCSGLVTTPAEVVEEGSGFGWDAGLGGDLLGADGDGG
jgi:hypothetical protein